MLVLMLKCCFAGKLLNNSPWNKNYAKSVQKDHKRRKKWWKLSQGRRSRLWVRRTELGEPPNWPLCAEFNRTSTLGTSPKRANRVRNGEPPKENGELMMCAEMKKREVKSANQNQKGEPPNENGESIKVADSSRWRSESASSSQTASRRIGSANTTKVAELEFGHKFLKHINS